MNRLFRSNTKKRYKGFTLIELLVVISVIAILSLVVLRLANPELFRSKSRDSRRIADLEKIRVALELYFSTERQYTDNLNQLVTGDYIQVIPTDPNGATYYNGGNYYYDSTVHIATARSGYVLVAQLENDLDVNDEHLCSKIHADLSANAGVTDAAGCYAVTSPTLTYGP